MKKLIFTLCIASSFLFTGCINVLEELFLNKDGSGQYVLSIDMSAMMNAQMRDMLKGMGEEQGIETPEETEPIEQDTLIKFSDVPAEQRGEISRPDFYDKVSMKMKASESKEEMIMSFILDFDKAEDINYFLQNMDKFFASTDEGGDNPLGALGGGGSDNPMSGLIPASGTDSKVFNITKKMLTRFKAPKPAEDLSQDENFAMLQMMLATAEYKTVYHFPGAVKSVSNSNATISGKDVTLTSSLVDVMTGEGNLDMEVKFKKK